MLPERLELRLALLLIGSAVAGLALFGDAGEPQQLRSQHYLWDLGHLGLGGFALLALHLLLPRLEQRPVWQQLLLALGCGALFGAVTEGLQGLVGRDASWRDLLIDTTGALLMALTLLARAPARRLRALFAIAVIAVAVSLPLLAYWADESAQIRQFPLLISGQNWMAATRFESGSARVHVAEQSGIALCMKPGKPWTGVTLRYFPEDWSGYRVLRYRMYLPGEQPAPLWLRIHDLAHARSDQLSHDRYNGLIRLTPGWNDFQVPLERIANTPSGRRMDLRHIRHLRWFTPKNLPTELCPVLTELRLER